MLMEITKQANLAIKELLQTAKLKKGDVFIVGCSSSEICGSRLGTNSSLETAQAVFKGIYPILEEQGVFWLRNVVSI